MRPCGHVFCGFCLMETLVNRLLCPFCGCEVPSYMCQFITCNELGSDILLMALSAQMP